MSTLYPIERLWKAMRRLFFLKKNSKKTPPLEPLHYCWVKITCSHPSEEGKMKVDMAYEGDEVVASYLLENAIQMLEEKRGISS